MFPRCTRVQRGGWELGAWRRFVRDCVWHATCNGSSQQKCCRVDCQVHVCDVCESKTGSSQQEWDSKSHACSTWREYRTRVSKSGTASHTHARLGANTELDISNSCTTLSHRCQDDQSGQSVVQVNVSRKMIGAHFCPSEFLPLAGVDGAMRGEDQV